MKKIFLFLAVAAIAVSCGSNNSHETETKECCEKYMIEKTTPNPENAALAQQFLKKAGTYYLATEENGMPRVRPFGTAEIFEGKLYIQTGKSKNVYKQLEANPLAEICAFVDGEWIRIQCELMLDKNPSLRGMYDENDDNTIVLYMQNATATIASFTAPSRTFQF